MTVNNIISHGWGVDLRIGKYVHDLHKEILEVVSNKISGTVVIVDTTWLGSDNIEMVSNQVINMNADVLILCSFVDATFITHKDFNHIGAKIISVGNFNEGNRIDFWSMLISSIIDIKKPTIPIPFKYPFLSYNNKPHPHRIMFREELTHLNLLDKGAVSFSGSNPILSPENTSRIPYEESGAGKLTLNDTMSLGDIEVWNSSFINIITETEFNPIDRWFYSEKTWKPIIGMRPFLHYTSGDVNSELSSWGFKTFENEFTDICDLNLSSHTNIATFCKILSEQPINYFNKKYNELLPAIKYNYTYFFEFVKKQHEKLENIHY